MSIMLNIRRLFVNFYLLYFIAILIIIMYIYQILNVGSIKPLLGMYCSKCDYRIRFRQEILLQTEYTSDLLLLTHLNMPLIRMQLVTDRYIIHKKCLVWESQKRTVKALMSWHHSSLS